MRGRIIGDCVVSMIWTMFGGRAGLKSGISYLHDRCDDIRGGIRGEDGRGNIGGRAGQGLSPCHLAVFKYVLGKKRGPDQHAFPGCG